MPPEIRNRIYREVLVDKGVIDFYSFGKDTYGYPCCNYFEAQNTVEPGLLRCCHAIRAEARPIFLEENHFGNYIQGGEMKPQLGHWFWKAVKPENRSIDHVGKVTAENIEEWLKAYWAGHLDEKEYEEAFRGLYNAIIWPCMTALRVVKHLKGVDWVVVENVLHELFDAIEMAANQGVSFE